MKVEVIIPVGPGHEAIMNEAASSVAIANAHSNGPFTEVGIRAFDDTKGEHGRSSARNQAVAQSDADWIYYLDADDMVMPELFTSLAGYENTHDAIWGQFGEIHELLIHERYQVRFLDGIKDLLKYNPQHTIKMGHFVKRSVAERYPFNTEMDTGEDWEYYLRIWAEERCVKVNGPLVYVKTRGQHSTGPRSATGRDWSISVMQQFDEARKKHGIS